jgi:endonuclease G, mitochondrial
MRNTARMSGMGAVALFFVACLQTPIWAASLCPEHFAGGVAPTITNPKLQARTQEVCFEAFAVLHSGISRTPLYSAERLTRLKIGLTEFRSLATWC